MPRTRALAGENEKLDIEKIVRAIHTRSQAGLKIMTAFTQRFATNIYDARARKGGNRSTHYDFEILVGATTEIAEWRNVEHKGGRDYRPIGPEETPWAAGVQFHNGGCEKYSIGSQYARVWYDTHISSGTLKTTWNLAAPIPSYEEWFEKDAKRQGDPKTAFGAELKKKVRARFGPRSSLLSDRAIVNEAFTPTPADLELLKEEALPILNDVLRQKHYWLTIHGDIDGEFYCAWYPPFLLDTIDSISVRKDLDIWFDFQCSVPFKLLLRWGKGAGFSNVRIDAR